MEAELLRTNRQNRKKGAAQSAPGNSEPIVDRWRVAGFEAIELLRGLDVTEEYPRHWHEDIYLCAILVDQMNAKLKDSFPAMFQTFDDVKGKVDLTPFRQRFAGTDKDLSAAFDDMAANLVKVVFEEASLR